tara:strand:+ start:888 stop:1097 length:210 start_codon:yes stop_codon:yes gene_type:complete
MLHIKSFFNKMTVMESKQSNTLVMTKDDARGLRDDISVLLADLHELSKEEIENKNEETIDIQVKGGSFK